MANICFVLTYINAGFCSLDSPSRTNSLERNDDLRGAFLMRPGAMFAQPLSEQMV